MIAIDLSEVPHPSVRALRGRHFGLRRIGGIRRVGSAISTTTVRRGQALSRAYHTHTCEPAETIGSFPNFQGATPWTYALALVRSATVTNRLTSNSVPSRIIA
jgi:hypothetical protein